jgi:hypothetical protein
VTLAKTVRLDALKESKQAPLHWFGGMSGCGTNRTTKDVRLDSVISY